MIKTIISEASSSDKGVSLRLVHPASLDGGLSARSWFVSWDRIEKALFGDQYTNSESLQDLTEERSSDKKHNESKG